MDKLDRKEKNRRLMAQGPVGSVIMKMAIPTIIAFLINSIYSLADTYFVSALGINATAAVTVNSSLDQLIMMCGSMLAVGANSYIARLLGEGNEKKAAKVLTTAFYFALGIGAVLLVFGSIFMEELMTLLGATPTCLSYSVDYARYVLLAAPFMAANFVMNQCLRSEGSATLSMVGMSFGGVLNVLLDWLMVPGCEALGIPAMGVMGASLATAISKVVSFGILIFPYLTRRSVLSLKIKNFCPSKDILGNIVAVGSSSMFRNGLAVVAGILLNDLAGNISDGVLAGIGVSTKIMMFPFSIILGFGTGFQPVAGFNWGAKQYDRVEKSFRFAAWTAALGAAAMCAVLMIFAEFLVKDIMGITDPVAIQISVLCIQLQCISLPAHAWVAIINMLCAGLGNAGGAMLLATSRQGSCFLPVLFPMAALWGQYGIASVQAVADVLSLALAIPICLYMVKKIKKAREGGDFVPKSEDFIAVFDSGVGGISVLRALVCALPEENFLYFGDSKNAPYGTKSTEDVKNLTHQAADMLFGRGAKALVVACNTATAAAIDSLRQSYPDKIIIGIEPAVKVAAEHFPKGRVGVLATPVTLREEKFTHLAESFPHMTIYPIGLGQLAEMIEGGVERETISSYLGDALNPMKDKLDAVVLGCTHYPLILDIFTEILGEKVAILDGSYGTAKQTKRRLQEAGLLRSGQGSVTMENSLPDKEILGRCMTLLEEKL